MKETIKTVNKDRETKCIIIKRNNDTVRREWGITTRMISKS